MSLRLNVTSLLLSGTALLTIAALPSGAVAEPLGASFKMAQAAEPEKKPAAPAPAAPPAAKPPGSAASRRATAEASRSAASRCTTATRPAAPPPAAAPPPRPAARRRLLRTPPRPAAPPPPAAQPPAARPQPPAAQERREERREQRREERPAPAAPASTPPASATPPAARPQTPPPPAASTPPAATPQPAPGTPPQDRRGQRDGQRDRNQPGAAAPATPPAAQPAPGTPPTAAPPNAPGSSPQDRRGQRGGNPPAGAAAPGTPPAPGTAPATPPAAAAPQSPAAAPLAPASAPAAVPAPTQRRDAGQFLQRRDNAAGGAANQTNVNVNIGTIRQERQETREGNRVFIREADRTIIREDNRTSSGTTRPPLRHRCARRSHAARGANSETVVVRPNGVRIVTVSDRDGRLVRRSRFDDRGREVVLIDNRFAGGLPWRRAVPQPCAAGRSRPRERYIVDYAAERRARISTMCSSRRRSNGSNAATRSIRCATTRRCATACRASISTSTSTPAPGSLSPEQVDQLAAIADGIKRAIEEPARRCS